MTRAEKRQAFWERNRKSGGYLLKKKIGQWLFSLGRAILIFGLCFLILQPLLQKLCVSFMAEIDLYDNTITSVPRHFSTISFGNAWRQFKGIKTFIRSLWLAVGVAGLQMLSCTLVGYGFARFKFPLKNMWFACVILVILIPPQTIVSSLYLHFRFFDIFGIIKLITGEAINLRGSKLPYYLMSATAMGLKNGLYIYMIRQFFRNIPGDMEEAAYVDGCGMLRTFARIMLPQSKPILSSCFLFAFVWQWTDGFYSKMFLGTTPLVSTSLARIVDSLGAYIQRISGIKTTISVAYSNCILSTGTLMIILPLIVIYLFAQRAFVESISATGIKM